MTRTRSKVGLGLAAAVLLLGGLGLRLWGIAFSPGNPYGRPDEEIFIRDAFRYFGTAQPAGVLRSGWPEGFFRIVHVLEVLELSFLQAWTRSPVHLACLYLIRPLAIGLLPRLFSALAGTAACLLVALMARRVVPESRQPSAFLFGIAALAVNYLVARDAHFGVSDATLLLCIAISLYFALRALGDDPVWLVPASLAAGAAFGLKYAAAPLLVPCAVAGLGCFFRHRQQPIAVAVACALGPLAAMVGFALLSPGALSHLHATLAGLLSHKQRYLAEGVNGFVLDPQAVLQPGWQYHLTVTLPAAFGMVGFALALIGLAACSGERWAVATLWAAALAFFAAVAPVHALFVRYASPITIPLAVGLAVSLSFIWEQAERFRRRGKLGLLGFGAGLALLALALGLPLQTLIAFDRVLAQPDTREQTADFVLAQGPGATLVTQGFYGEIHGLEASAWEACAPRVPAWLLRRVPQLPGQHLDWQQLVQQDSSHWGDLVQQGISRYLAGASPPVNEARFVAEGHLVLECGRPARIDAEPLDPACFTPVARFTPGTLGCRDKVDIFDCFFMPYAAFDGVERPGPDIVVSRNTCLQ